MATTLVWLRDDLRLADNPALHAATGNGDDVILCYVWDDESPGIRPLGGAARWWLHHSLSALDASVRALGGTLILRRGAAGSTIPEMIRQTGATSVFWNRRYGLAERTVDAGLKDWCAKQGVAAASFKANVLFEPGEVRTGAGEPYKVFTPFWRACMDRTAPRGPFPAPRTLSGAGVPSDPLDSWNLLPTTPDWAHGLAETWTPGEDAAQHRLLDFLDSGVAGYRQARERPAVEGTSRLSPHLRFGEISPFSVWDAVQARTDSSLTEDLRIFRTELGWREFCNQLLYFNPELATRNYRSAFDAFRWEKSGRAEVSQWSAGSTGYPLIDAGMRQLWHTGWMHNRVRMATASFLVKNLLIDWRVGEQWFWDTLVDADAASNAANWQWVAGSGADASPYFRIFNPVTQSRKFDPDAEYLLRFVPELRSANFPHEPWKESVEGYPAPIVDLQESRQRALSAYQKLRGT